MWFDDTYIHIYIHACIVEHSTAIQKGLAICDSIDRIWDLYAKWNRQGKTNIASSYLYVELKKNLIESHRR